MKCTVGSIGIIGYGRFGKLVARLLAELLPQVEILIYTEQAANSPIKKCTIEQLAKADIVIPCVPIKAFASTIERIAPFLAPSTLIIDVCSVKIHPREIMESVLPASVQCIGTHPMFGPGTYQKRLQLDPRHPLKGLTIVIDRIRCSDDRYGEIITFLKSVGLNLVEMTADAHDRLASRFQFICLTTAFVLKKMELTRSAIDTESASLMMDYLEMISVDPQLVRDLYTFNPYCAVELKTFEEAFKSFMHFLEEGS